VPFARSLDELVIVAPAGDAEDARSLSDATGAVLITVDGPRDVARALDELLSRR